MVPMSADPPISEGFVPFRGHRTWYRVVGDRVAAGKLPLVLLNGGPGVPHDYFEPLAEWARAGRLPGIAAPALVLGGRHDECTPAIQEDLHHRLPGSERVVFEQSAHLPHLEEPERFREAVEGFLDRVEGGAA
jgi:pimeloyl-ACP methyl ester carboxylesterase